MSLRNALLTAGLALSALSCVQAAPVVMSGMTLEPVTLRARHAPPVKLSLGQAWSQLAFSNGSVVGGGLPSPAVAPAGAVGFFNVSTSKFTTTSGAWVHESTADVGTRVRRTLRSHINIDSLVNSVTVESTTGQILSLQNAGSFTLKAPLIDGVLDGGTVTFRNVRIDLPGQRVLADIEAVSTDESGAPIPGTESRIANATAWTFDAASGPKTIPVAALSKGAVTELILQGFSPRLISNGRYLFQGTLSIAKLTMPAETMMWLQQSLGAFEGSVAFNYIASVNEGVDGWGALQTTYTLVMPNGAGHGQRDEDRHRNHH